MNIVALVYVAEKDWAITPEAVMDLLEETDIIPVLPQVIIWGNRSYRIQGCYCEES